MDNLWSFHSHLDKSLVVWEDWTTTNMDPCVTQEISQHNTTAAQVSDNKINNSVQKLIPPLHSICFPVGIW